MEGWNISKFSFEVQGGALRAFITPKSILKILRCHPPPSWPNFHICSYHFKGKSWLFDKNQDFYRKSRTSIPFGGPIGMTSQYVQCMALLGILLHYRADVTAPGQTEKWNLQLPTILVHCLLQWCRWHPILFNRLVLLISHLTI